jgi:hypothetical protein
MDSNTKPPIYDLYAISNHIGGMYGGHYNSYALHETDQNWYKLDDAHCSLVHDPSYIITPNAYLLFYKSRNPPPYSWPEPIQLDDEDPKPPSSSTTIPTTTICTTITSSPVSSPPVSAPQEEPSHMKENTKYFSPHMYDPIITQDDEPFHPHFVNDYGPYHSPARKPLAQSLYICPFCNETLPGLEEYQVHILTEHYAETGTEDLLLN